MNHIKNKSGVTYGHTVNIDQTVGRIEKMERDNPVFEYTYCAPQQEEVKKIREKYLPKEETKMEQLRRLDESSTKKGMACSLMLGITSALVLGIGMCCTMLWQGVLFIPGVIIGCAGIAGMALAHPLHAKITRKERARLAPEILKLTNELMNGQT